MSDTNSLSPLNRIRRRRAGATTSSNVSGSRAGSAAGINRLYSDESPGLKVDPIVVLVLSMIFIGSVFVLHIWGKYTRGA